MFEAAAPAPLCSVLVELVRFSSEVELALVYFALEELELLWRSGTVAHRLRVRWRDDDVFAACRNLSSSSKERKMKCVHEPSVRT